MSRIYIIGFMGAGKSTVGKILAEKLAYDFVDVDEFIESRMDLTIPEIFLNFGEEAFRALESSALHTLSKRDNIVLATGGGTPCYNQNMDVINRTGISVYLNLGAEELFKRLSDERSHRPLISGLDDADLMDFIRDRLAERSQHYLKSHFIVNYQSLPEELADQIILLITKK